MALLVEANPVPDLDALDAVGVGATRYLAILEQGSSEMAKTEEKTEQPDRGRRRPLAGMALAAAAVVVLGTVTWLGLEANETDSVSAGVAVSEEFAKAVSSGETDLSRYVTDDATFGPMVVPIDDDLAEFWAGLETSITLSDCEQTAQVVRCDYESTDRIRQVQGRPEYGTLTFLIEGSRIGAISRDWDDVASRWLRAGDPVIHYLEWLNETHPGWDDELDWVGEPLPIGGGYAPLAHDDPIRNARYAEALSRYLDEYEQHLATSGGLSD
ncbi:MAG: hypothetical protein R6X29_00750 [Acidimicrobiia bacterium]